MLTILAVLFIVFKSIGHKEPKAVVPLMAGPVAAAGAEDGSWQTLSNE
jgi:hypothetical protein